MNRAGAGGRAWRSLLLIVAGALAAGVVVAFGVATMVASRDPALSLAILPGNPRAADVVLTSMAAQGQIGSGHPAFGKLARQVFRIDGSDPVAIRSLALDEQAMGHDDRADALYRHAYRLSRRDYPTNVYMLAMEARQGQIARSLETYDITLRSAPSPALLFATLARGVDRTGLHPYLVDLAQRNPPWFGEFIDWFVAQHRAPKGLAAVLLGARQSASVADPDRRRRLLAWMVRHQDYDDAYAFYRGFSRLRPGQPAWSLAFDSAGGYPPFDWAIADGSGPEDGFGGKIGPSGLDYWSQGGGGLIAQKLVLLPQGQYTIVGHLASVSAATASPDVSVVCASDGSTLLRLALTVGAAQGRFQSLPNCRAYWINLNLTRHSGDDNDTASGRVDLALLQSDTLFRVASQ